MAAISKMFHFKWWWFEGDGSSCFQRSRFWQAWVVCPLRFDKNLANGNWCIVMGPWFESHFRSGWLVGDGSVVSVAAWTSQLPYIAFLMKILNDKKAMSCPIKNNSNTIELTLHTSCYWVLRLTLYYYRL